MIMRPNGVHSRALVLALAAAAVDTPLAAQPAHGTADSSHRFALFGGRSDSDILPERGIELGASADFRWTPIPVPLRVALSFSQRDEPYTFQPYRVGQASVDLVMRPIPKTFGIQPYFLGGLGIATRAPYSGYYAYVLYDPLGLNPPPSYTYTRERDTWAFASGGVGLDVGRVFLQVKYEEPVASQGTALFPISVGFRFWD